MSQDSEQGGVVPLSLLTVNQEGRITRVGGDEAVRHRVEEMGLCPGTVVRMLRCKQPQIIAINGRRLSLRTNSQLEIWVEPA